MDRQPQIIEDGPGTTITLNSTDSSNARHPPYKPIQSIQVSVDPGTRMPRHPRLPSRERSPSVLRRCITRRLRQILCPSAQLNTTPGKRTHHSVRRAAYSQLQRSQAQAPFFNGWSPASDWRLALPIFVSSLRVVSRGFSRRSFDWSDGARCTYTDYSVRILLA